MEEVVEIVVKAVDEVVLKAVVVHGEGEVV